MLQVYVRGQITSYSASVHTSQRARQNQQLKPISDVDRVYAIAPTLELDKEWLLHQAQFDFQLGKQNFLRLDMFYEHVACTESSQVEFLHII